MDIKICGWSLWEKGSFICSKYNFMFHFTSNLDMKFTNGNIK